MFCKQMTLERLLNQQKSRTSPAFFVASKLRLLTSATACKDLPRQEQEAARLDALCD
jgi:hypothetical protein